MVITGRLQAASTAAFVCAFIRKSSKGVFGWGEIASMVMCISTSDMSATSGKTSVCHHNIRVHSCCFTVSGTILLNSSCTLHDAEPNGNEVHHKCRHHPQFWNL